MAHACGCRHGSSRSSAASLAPVRPDGTVGEIVQRDPGALHGCGAGLTLAEASASVGMPLTTLLAALNEGRKAPA